VLIALVRRLLVVLEELGGVEGPHPIPAASPTEHGDSEFAYGFTTTLPTPEPNSNDGRWTHAPSIDEFHHMNTFTPVGQEPRLGAPDPRGHAQTEQMGAGGVVKKVKKML
jgi:Mn-containing catalase